MCAFFCLFVCLFVCFVCFGSGVVVWFTPCGVTAQWIENIWIANQAGGLHEPDNRAFGERCFAIEATQEPATGDFVWWWCYSN